MRNKILNMKLEVKSYYLFFGVLLLSQLFEFGNGYDLADSKIESSLAKPDQESKITRFHENFPAIVYQREQLIVTTANGKLWSIDDGGNIKWVIEFPMIFMSTNYNFQLPHFDNKPPENWDIDGPILFPMINGNLMMVSKHSGFQELNESIPEIVNNSPYLSEYGYYITGALSKEMFLIDLDTGDLVPKATKTGKHTNIVFHKYHLRVLDPVYGWNIEYGLLSDSLTTDLPPLQDHNQFQLTAQGEELNCFIKGRRKWSPLRFDSPIIDVYSVNAGSISRFKLNNFGDKTGQFYERNKIQLLHMEDNLVYAAYMFNNEVHAEYAIISSEELLPLRLIRREEIVVAKELTFHCQNESDQGIIHIDLDSTPRRPSDSYRFSVGGMRSLSMGQLIMIIIVTFSVGIILIIWKQEREERSIQELKELFNNNGSNEGSRSSVGDSTSDSRGGHISTRKQSLTASNPPVIISGVMPKETTTCSDELRIKQDVILGYGSLGTIVYEGTFKGRKVAVKRMLSPFYEIANKETQILITSDAHPHVIRYYTKSTDHQFIYLALEKCAGSLHDLMTVFSTPSLGRGKLEGGQKDVWDLFSPSELNLVSIKRLLYECMQGLNFLHKMKIVHRDLKPQNILISKFKTAKLSDMGLSRQLGEDEISFETNASGSMGWQAAEVLEGRKRHDNIDIFSMGCVFYYCLTNGGHPFGQRLSRERNIIAGKQDLSALKYYGEAHHLINAMISINPKMRPSTSMVLSHIFFWDSEKKLNYIIDLSDRIEFETTSSWLCVNLERTAKKEDLLKIYKGKWSAAIEKELVDDCIHHRKKYNFQSVSDLIRMIRNKKMHYRELSPVIQKKIGCIPDGFLTYFTSKFPLLMIALYKFGVKNLFHDTRFSKQYFENVQD